MIYNIISRLHYRTTDNIILNFYEDAFVRHEFCKTNLHINFMCEHENNTKGFTQTINALIQQEAIRVWHSIKSARQIHDVGAFPTARF